MTPKTAGAGAPRSPTPLRLDLGGGAVGFVESSPALPLVSIVVALRAGGAADPQGKDGLVRFTGRLLRRGCEGMSSTDIEAAIDGLGGELGLDVGPSSTSLHGQVIRRNLRPFCELLAKILGRPTFADEELGRLKRETKAEIVEARDSDRSLASVAFRRALFGGHPYGRGATGRISTVDTIDKDDVLTTYRRTFVRGDLVVGFAGAITEEEARGMGALLAAALPEGAPASLDIPEPPAPSGRRLYFVDKPERTQTQILIGGLGTSAHDPDHVPLLAATAVLGGTFTSRLMREIRSKRGWSYGTSARLSVDRRRHAFVMSAAPGAADCAPCVALELQMLEEFVASGITARELGFIKNYLVRSHAFEVDTASKRLHQALDVELLGLPADYHARHVEHVRAVTLEQANAAVGARLSSEDLVIVVVGTADELLDELTSAVPGLAGHEVLAFDRD